MARSAEEMAACQAYLNAGHAANFSAAKPLPDGTPGSVFLFKSQWTENFNWLSTGSAGTDFALVLTPSFEYPFAIISENGQFARGIANRKALSGNTSPMTYLKDNHVYALRCLGKTATVTDQTPVIDKRGVIVAQHKQPDVDHIEVSYNDALARASTTNTRCMQRIPCSAAEVSDLGNYYNTALANGCYLQAHHTSRNWMVRDTVVNKMSALLTTPQLNADTQSRLNMTTYSTGGVTAIMDYATPVLTCLTSGLDNTDMAIAAFDGLNNATLIQVKFTVVYELLLKPSSALYQERIPRPLFNPALMDLLHAYEAYRSQLPGGGTLLGADNDWNSIWSGLKAFASRFKDVGKSLLANIGVTDIQSGLALAAKAAPFALAML